MDDYTTLWGMSATIGLGLAGMGIGGGVLLWAPPLFRMLQGMQRRWQIGVGAVVLTGIYSWAMLSAAAFGVAAFDLLGGLALISFGWSGVGMIREVGPHTRRGCLVVNGLVGLGTTLFIGGIVPPL